jgi:hypothetical protein
MQVARQEVAPPTGLRSQLAKSRNPMTKVSELASNQITSSKTITVLTQWDPSVIG